ncbi:MULTISPECIES: isopenicillin N synthase family dioxygenase [Pacificibacter]|uniref:isopenicillin N synthase family dioxygenase n=1 Tax=Pacificibacter TaxID=1042323 RepID=UPI001C0811EB|nr:MULTISPECIES: 2-oxoglutarate and iron-dependent oxygenase domain-containing protein [Pacificibacter]MBU2935151.1 isopenicillin N synthase family oxygenase [Pacificibacter marinus]MDO6615942.1 2-oxoglutarate and iron-dependent oxygenase domain-containing protein [Pacificibacter sp. 1_MG-2023]
MTQQTLTAARVEAASLPIIDVADLSSSDPSKRAAVGAALRAACLDKGFFYCSGHGIPQGLIDAAFQEARALFDLPDADKDLLDKSNSNCNRGYETLGGQTLETGAMPDRKEGYYIGVELPENDPRVVEGRFNRGPNIWPSDLAGFQPTMQAYYAALSVLGETLMRGIALSLDLPEDTFAPYCQDHLATLRLLHYPPARPYAPDERGAGAHTDFGGLTILMQDDNGGLQVFDAASDGWIHADPVPGTFVVNLGDMIARWTNDRYRSTLHRVMNTSGRERYSIPFFYVGNPDYEVKCIPTCLEPGESPKYDTITVEGHLNSMYKKTYVSK